ncbi:(2Fe-2S) ferredoxin domain-containing protein [Clostridium sp. SYSU_GA19001]|nr:(2Fe-2S) ferredoxin domain-containing protein [Clostridium caldaquaticum]
MLTISVCVGSSCHLKGSYNVIKELQSEIAKLNIEKKIELKASFCLGHCTSAVSVKINDEPVLSLSADNVPEFLQTHVLSRL